ncbi:hypothetical protein KDW_63680 [Dictyobacter vulcani]|uniref:Uncharacterized protein n=1 Tax=Dictyobacter vulcani TaxID=2607529 RepID=A0A5J4L414_9CHLR|nr:hypothetical protein KDW_63680 [Dictyobacter vulcani]
MIIDMFVYHDKLPLCSFLSGYKYDLAGSNLQQIAQLIWVGISSAYIYMYTV